MEKGRKKVEMNRRIQKEKPGKPQVLSVSARQDLNLRPLRPELSLMGFTRHYKVEKP